MLTKIGRAGLFLMGTQNAVKLPIGTSSSFAEFDHNFTLFGSTKYINVISTRAYNKIRSLTQKIKICDGGRPVGCAFHNNGLSSRCLLSHSRIATLLICDD